MATKLFDDWNVQLAKTYEPGVLKDGEWFSISQKINGVRCTYFADELVSRSGNRIEGFDDIKADLRQLCRLCGNYAIDGELRLHDIYARGMNDNEAFKYGTGIVNATRDFSQKHKLQFIIFDCVPMREWSLDCCSLVYADRLKIMEVMGRYIEEHDLFKLRIVPMLYCGKDQERIETCLLEATRCGWEGIMINRNAKYQFKRTNVILKYKSFNTIDLECVGMIEGTGKYEGSLGSLCCKFGDNIVNVGTGFDDNLRKFIWDMGTWINGKIIEVKYKDITSDAITGLKSLQFPVFVQIKTDKHKPDTMEAVRNPNSSGLIK